MAQSASDAKEQAGTAKGKKGLRIAFRSWHPNGQARGILVIVPGFKSHSGYYVQAAGQFVAAGLAVYAIDLRGRGRSDGERFYVDDFSDYVSDIAVVVDLVKSNEPSPQIFLLGHSAGGVAACLYALDHQTELEGLICESFAYELPAPGFALSAIKGLSHLAPRAHILQLVNSDFSRDPKVVQEMNGDPLIAQESQPAETVAALIRADERLAENFQRIALPLLILHGTADKAAKVSGSRHFHEMAGSSDKTLKLYDGAFHDLLNDLGKENVISDLIRWIDAHLAA